MGKKPRWTVEEDAILREFYIPAPKGCRYSSVYKKLPGRTKDAIAGRARYCGLVSDEKTRVITAFLEAAAEQGWRMVPEEATDEMVDCTTTTTRLHGLAGDYRAMLAAAPKFRLDKQP